MIVELSGFSASAVLSLLRQPLHDGGAWMHHPPHAAGKTSRAGRDDDEEVLE
jgi:hypothetical protein